MRSMSQHPLVRDILFIVGFAAILALTVNAFSAKRVPLIRQTVDKISVGDEALFTALPPRADTARPDSSRPASAVQREKIRVVAPLHEQALKRAESTAVATPPSPASSLRMISLDQFTRLQRDSRPFVIDARDSAAYREGHVRGAHNAYGLAIEDYFDRLVPIPRDTLIVVYCNNPDCHLGRMVIQFMRDIGFTNMLLYDDGWDGWAKAKLPADTTNVRW